MKDYIVDTELDLINLFKNLGDLWQEKRYLKVVCKTNRSRTGTQNNAIHKYCRELAEELNAAGYTSQVRFKGRDVPGIEVEWTQDSVKALWSALQIALFPDTMGKTSNLERDQVSKVYRELDSNIATITNGVVSVGFPSKDGPVLRERSVTHNYG